MNISTINFTKRIKINILFFPILLAAILGGYLQGFLIAYACATLHELAHLFVAGKLKLSIECIEVLPFGICGRLKSDIIKNPTSEILIALAGPFSNFMLCTAATVLLPFGEFKDYFVLCNLSMAALNLIPTLPLDGGRVLYAVLCKRFGTLKARRTALRFSRIPVCIILLSGALCLMVSKFNFSLILIGSFLVSNLCREEQTLPRIALGDMLDYKTKPEFFTMGRSIVLTARPETPARHILNRLSPDRYHIIHIIDDRLKVTATLTEGQLINALNRYGAGITLGEIA